MAASLFTQCDSNAANQTNAQGKYENTDTNYQTGLSTIWQVLKAYIRAERAAPVPQQAVPVKALTKEHLVSLEQDTLFKLGHSSVLLSVNKQLILLDPVFSERASPVQWAGPKRFHQPPISLEELPNIDAVVISHDHYDHLDEHAIKALANKAQRFIVPLSVGKYLRKWGVADEKITELNWWQNTYFNGVELIATPTQHFSGRGVFDRDETLWASWVIRTEQTNIFFSGDSGYFSGFKTIGEKYGPFDLTMVETGAYNELWKEIHMTPEESVNAHLDLQGKVMMPIHNGTFDLALHDWDEPLERVSSYAKEKQVILLTPIFGEAYTIGKTPKENLWWQAIQ